MGYLVCEECGGYYELQEGESIEDFGTCQCGGNLKYARSVAEIYRPEEATAICLKCGTENKITNVSCSKCSSKLETPKHESNQDLKKKLQKKLRL